MDKQFESLMNDVDAQLEFIINADDLRIINDLLSTLMTVHKAQALIKEDNLNTIADAIIDLALIGEGDKQENILLASAMLGRLGAVSRSREEQVYARLDELFDEEPISIIALADADEKKYAARAIVNLNKSWLVSYCIQQSILIDTAENARTIFLDFTLKYYANLSDCWKAWLDSLDILKSIEDPKKRFTRVQRITAAWLEAVKVWQGEVGQDPGQSLAAWSAKILRGDKKSVDEQVLFDIVDDILAMLLRLVELRFSFALLAPTYEVIDKARAGLGHDLWGVFMQYSIKLESVRLCLKETSLVLARQNRTDSAVMDVLCKAYYSRAQVIPALKAYFSESDELNNDVLDWWVKGGLIAKDHRKYKQKMGNSEDQLIGSLLIEVEASKTVMEKLKSAVVPIIEISDPSLAATVTKAASGYGDMARIARQLARMRKLSHTDLLGTIPEYNPVKHEMLGGHVLGVRNVKVIREGIQKEFGGKTKILVKPWVEPVEK